MRNKLTDLNNHLFEELEKLTDDDLQGESLKEELQKAKIISEVSGKIIDNASLILKAIHEQNEYGGRSQNIPPMLLGLQENEKSMDK